MPEDVSGAALREIMRRVPSPVTIVTTVSRGEIRGMTAGSFTSICLEPPLVSFNVTRTSGMYRVIKEASFCAVHLLGEGQLGLARWFARPDLDGPEQFDDVPYRIDDHGLPIIRDTFGVLTAALIAEHEAGDSAVMIARVVDTNPQREGRPLLYYKSSYRTIGEEAEESAYRSLSAPANGASNEASDTPTPNSAKS